MRVMIALCYRQNKNFNAGRNIHKQLLKRSKHTDFRKPFKSGKRIDYVGMNLLINEDKQWREKDLRTPSSNVSYNVDLSIAEIKY